MELVWEYFGRHYEPRLPFTVELTRYPKRSTYYEVFLATSTLTASVLLITSLEYIVSFTYLRHLVKVKSLVDALQLLMIVVPFQAAVLDYPVGNYTDFVVPFDAFCLLLCAACCLHRRWCSAASSVDQVVSQDHERCQQLQQAVSTGRVHNDCLTIFRSVVYVFTAVCIFARDQPCWYNEFGKAVSFGTGLMDIGIGCFVICIGSLGPTVQVKRAVELDRPAGMRKAGAQFLLLSTCGLVKSIYVVLHTAVKRSSNPTFYEPVWREYGVHWNAFYSLAVAKLAGTAVELHLLPTRVPPLLAGLAVGVGHETLLACAGLAEYVMAPGQPEPHYRGGDIYGGGGIRSLLAANREGVCSAPGLLALYLIGTQFGRWTNEWSRGRRSPRAMCCLVGRLAAVIACCLAYRIALAHLPDLLLPESRRLLNLSYCAWVTAFAAFCLVSVCLMLSAKLALMQRQQLQQASCPSAAAGGSDRAQLSPLHLARVDSAGLLYFLISNLLTASANLLISLVFPDREDMDGAQCFGVVLLYMIVVHPVARLAQQVVSVRAVMNSLVNCLTF